jgi:hypothetical protein
VGHSQRPVDRALHYRRLYFRRAAFVIFVGRLLDNILDIQPQDHKTMLLILGDRWRRSVVRSRRVSDGTFLIPAADFRSDREFTAHVEGG